MNYLAHALLAEPYAHSLIGNLAGDLIKGPLGPHALHPRVADGVRRHRRIDALTDTHPAYGALRAEFPHGERRVAGIVLDVVFDFFLTRHWSCFSSWDRGDFITGVYVLLGSGDAPLPQPLARLAPRWVAADWLRVYETREGVAAVVDRLSRRLAGNSAASRALSASLQRVWENEQRFEQGFLSVFDDVQLVAHGLRARSRGP